MISSRRLNADTDQAVFDLVQEWRQYYPRRYKEWDAVDGPACQYWALADHPDCVHVGVQEDGEWVAMVLFRHVENGWFEGHLEARRGFSFEKLHAVIWEWGWGLFELGAVALYAWVMDPNRVSITAVKSLGLTYDGTVRWMGIFRGKIAKSRRYTLQRSTWLNWYQAAKASEGNNGEAKTGADDHSRDNETRLQPEECH